MPSLFEMPIEKIKGVGEKKAALLHRLGVQSVGDILYYFPRDYEDWTTPIDIADAVNGTVCCIKATVGSAVVDSYTKMSGMIVSKTTAFDDTSAISLVFFNNPYISKMLKYDETYFFYGKITKDIYGIQMASPYFSPVAKGASIHPIYRLTAGLTNKMISQIVESAITMMPQKVNDPLPDDLSQKYGLCSLDFAIKNIHFPKNQHDLSLARKRLIFEELLILNLGLRGLKSKRREQTSIKINKDFSSEFEKLLPFCMTNAQKSAINQCVEDFSKNSGAMNRIIQGDVGSGKTVVGASVCYTVIKNGYQCAFMVPTEILAVQHFKNLSDLFKNTNVKVEMLTGSLKSSQKKDIRERLQNGEIDLIIGTHALITESTQFKNLGLAVTDEQHRFGVSQRSKLISKGSNPHLLVMSATPIPRTLGLIIYGDLEISIINELPPGRQEIDTLLIDSSKRQRAYNFIKKQINNGNQCYVVCPLVEEGELELASAENYAAELMLNEFANYAVGILHGKMKQADKEKVMNDFAKGEISLLVATTVIEVGVDVPNATVMMIENAERFGLSQLHQLRGRVGRGKSKSYCILLSDNKNEETAARLQTMCKTSNGFEIAEEDLKLRGPGDFFGHRQHGLPTLAIADLTDMENLELSQKAANEIISLSPDLSDVSLRGIKAEIKRLFSNTGSNILN